MSVKVNIFGTEYPVKGDADPDYIEEVAAYVDAKMTEVASAEHLDILHADTHDRDLEERLSALAIRVKEGLGD